MTQWFGIHPTGGVTVVNSVKKTGIDLYDIYSVVGGPIDFVALEQYNLGLFLHDEGLLLDFPLNLPMFLGTGYICSGAVLLTAMLPDDEGDTLPVPPDNEAVKRILGIANYLEDAQTRLAQMKLNVGVPTEMWQRWEVPPHARR